MTARQQLGKLVTLAFFGNRQLTRLAASGGIHPKAGTDTADDDPVTFSPGSTTQRMVGMQPLGCAAIERGQPQFTARLEADPPAVLGEEHVTTTCCPYDRLRIESVEIAPKQNHRVTVAARINDGPAARCQRKVDSWLSEGQLIDGHRRDRQRPWLLRWSRPFSDGHRHEQSDERADQQPGRCRALPRARASV